MTLYTDRRTIQTTNIDRVLRRADYFAQMRGSDYSQPDITPFEAEDLGLDEVWSDAPLDPVAGPRPERPSLSSPCSVADATGTSPVATTVRRTTLDVSVVLPVYNERGHLRTEIERIQRALTASPYSFEIIVVDDGSNDGSEVDLPTIEGIRLIRHSHNRGSGTARRTGTTAARGRVVVWTDVDMTYPNDEIPMLVKEMDGFDHVVGARRTEQGTKRFFRVPAKWFIRKLASYLTETDIPDLNSGLRAFRRDVAHAVRAPPAGRVLVRDDADDVVPVQRLLGEVRADRLLPAGRHVEVPLVARHQALPVAGRADDAVVQPAEGVPADRAGAARCSGSPSSSTTGSTGTSGSPPTRC